MNSRREEKKSFKIRTYCFAFKKQTTRRRRWRRIDADEKMRYSLVNFIMDLFVCMCLDVSHLVVHCLKVFQFSIFICKFFYVVLFLRYREIVTIHLWKHKFKQHTNLKSCKPKNAVNANENEEKLKLWNANFMSILLESKQVQTKLKMAHKNTHEFDTVMMRFLC